jgi:carbon storage regulator
VLVLSRRPGESIVIGNQVVVTIVEVRGDQIRIGIDAPRDVQVHREEVFRELEAQNAQAASSADRARRMVARMPSAARRPDGMPPRSSSEPDRTGRPPNEG